MLQAVDESLRAFQFANEFNKQKALYLLQDAYDDWASSKADVHVSVRNRNGSLADFKAWMNEQQALLLPAIETGWNTMANCYAYAMKCKVFAGRVPTPGVAAGHKVDSADRRWQQQQQKVRYHYSLLEGVVDDARACGRTVEILSGPADGEYPPVSFPPIARAGSTHYLVGMVAKDDGFHFMRRDSSTGLWSHKNGGLGSEVETGAALWPPSKPGRTARYVPIDDNVAQALLGCQSGKYVNFAHFRFVGYLLVPSGGITVGGA
ncbi:hypothetical protein D0T23_12185 [Duganella sp. BJB475]|nr:hypothetical protein D0T23_12185 [Duganella sp. BJB475]RFP31101.1 hypothetical protein D0T21_14565 [Duganella sp. BJB476]